MSKGRTKFERILDLRVADCENKQLFADKISKLVMSQTWNQLLQVLSNISDNISQTW